jgi:L-cysteine S-thiosulfotransferase
VKLQAALRCRAQAPRAPGLGLRRAHLLQRSPGLVLKALALAGAAAASLCSAAETSPAALGDAERGRAWLLQRFETGCILCHEVPGLPAGGNLGPPLRAMAERYNAAQLRDRIADARRFNPQTIMPPYASTAGLQFVAPAYQGKTVLTEQALQDIVAYLLKPAPDAATRPGQARVP